MRLALVWAAAALPLSSALKAAVVGADDAPTAASAAATLGTEEARARLAALRAGEARRDRAQMRKTVGGASPVPPLAEPNRSTPVVLEVSAFLDGERCALTLYRALSKAEHPERVSFHLLQARTEQSPDCLAEFRAAYLPKVCEPGAALAQAEGVSGEDCQQRVLSRSHAWLLNATNGEGPVHQRGISTSLLEYHREDAMCLSSDSHMDFEQGWDTTMLADWASTRNEFAVLTAYPAQVGSRPRWPAGEFIDLCGYFPENGVPRGMGGGNLIPEPNAAPYLTVNWAAGLSFHRCHAEKNVPVDWHLRWIFTGEEIDRAVRLFTSGYDLYLPTNIAVTHNYTHASQAFYGYGGGDAGAWGQWSRERLRRLFDGGSVREQAPGHKAGAAGLQGGVNFGVGTQRSIEDFVRWGRVNLGGRWPGWLSEQGITPMSEPESHHFCKTLPRLPVRDEVDLVASVGSKPDRFDADDKGNVRFYGNGEELNVKKML